MIWEIREVFYADYFLHRSEEQVYVYIIACESKSLIIIPGFYGWFKFKGFSGATHLTGIKKVLINSSPLLELCFVFLDSYFIHKYLQKCHYHYVLAIAFRIRKEK